MLLKVKMITIISSTYMCKCRFSTSEVTGIIVFLSSSIQLCLFVISSVRATLCSETHNCMMHFVFFVRLEKPMTGMPWMFTSVGNEEHGFIVG